MRVAINGFGRIGRLFLRQALQERNISVVAINDLGDLENLAYLFASDTVYGKFDGTVTTSPAEHALVINKKKIVVLQEKDPARLPWRDLKIDVVIESTGIFDSFEKAKAHVVAGARHAVISAPAKDSESAVGRTIILGINDGDIKNFSVTSNGSCTTNACAPVIKILSETLGIEKAILNTTHAYTATQSIVDSPVKGSDFRRGRAGAQNVAPSSTGAAIAVGRVVPEVVGKFDGVAVRVPVVAGSLADITFIAKKTTTTETVNELLKTAARNKRWNGTLKVSDEQLVSTDVIGEPYGAIVDARSTKVVDGNLVKVLVWYDNEWGYVSTLIKHIKRI